MNYMKQIAEMLGVEMGERFKIKGYTNNAEYYISEQGLMREGFTSSHRKVLADILAGEIKVVKKPWKPKCGELFSVVSPQGEIYMSRFDDSAFSFMCLYMGNCFYDSKDAEAHKDEVMAKFKAVME